MSSSHHLPHLPARRDARYFYLLMTLVTLILVVPVLDHDLWGGPIVGAVAGASMIVGLRAVARNRRTLVIAFVLGFIGYAVSVVCYYTDLSPLAAQPFQFAFYSYLTLSILHSVLASERVTTDEVCGGIAVYLLLGICWAIIYGGIEFISPGSIREVNALETHRMTSPQDFVYFSFVTLTALGYGDIVPVSKTVRMAAMIEAVVGLLYIAVFIGRLVALTSTRAHPRPQRD